MIDPFLPEQREIIPPAEGWKPETLYLVKVSLGRGNPVHEAFLHVGFLKDDGTPGSYSEFWCHSYDSAHKFSEAYYLRAVRLLYEEE